MTLDDFLGPRTTEVGDGANKVGTSEALARGLIHGQQWRAEAPVVAILERFTELVGEAPKSARLRKSWIAAARDYVAECGETPDLLEAAYWEMRKSLMTIATARSLITAALELRRRGANQEDRGRYLTQDLVDDMNDGTPG